LKGGGKMAEKTPKDIFKDLIKSFKCAFCGIRSSFENERNMTIHFGVMALVVMLGIFLKIARTEWIILIILFGIVISAEMINTSLEALTDLVKPKFHPQAKLIKDIAAGAVLILAIAAAIIGFIIFAPKIYNLIF
jgi:diacylglycerol kinase